MCVAFSTCSSCLYSAGVVCEWHSPTPSSVMYWPLVEQTRPYMYPSEMILTVPPGGASGGSEQYLVSTHCFHAPPEVTGVTQLFPGLQVASCFTRLMSSLNFMPLVHLYSIIWSKSTRLPSHTGSSCVTLTGSAVGGSVQCVQTQFISVSVAAQFPSQPQVRV